MFASLRLAPARCRGAALVTLAVGIAIASSASDAQAYCRTVTEALPASYNPVSKGCYTQGLFLYWKNACVSFSINQNGSVTAKVPYATAQTVIDQAFARWTNATCADTGAAPGIAVSDYGSSTCEEVRYNKDSANQNLIVFRDTTWPYSDPNNTLGLTTVTFDATTGEIFDADMELNATAGNLSTTEQVRPNGYDLASVVTHEAGHFFGLAHAQSPTSTMYASYKPGTTALRTLSADDIAGICEIYPSTASRLVSRPPSSSVDATITTTIAADACDYDPRHGFTTLCQASSPSSSSGGCTTSSTGPSSATPSPGLRPEYVALACAALGLVVVRRRRQRKG